MAKEKKRFCALCGFSAALQALYGDTSCLQMRLNPPPYKAGYRPAHFVTLLQDAQM